MKLVLCILNCPSHNAGHQQEPALLAIRCMPLLGDLQALHIGV
jgi:hypothetical protein